jgi:hypothetical protein
LWVGPVPAVIRYGCGKREDKGGFVDLTQVYAPQIFMLNSGKGECPWWCKFGVSPLGTGISQQ